MAMTIRGCDWGGCDNGRALGSKYCPQHRDELSRRIGTAATSLPARDTGTLDMFAPAPERLPPAPAARGQDTSTRAAQATQQKAKGQALTLLRLIQATGLRGLTCDELELATGWAHQTVSGRLWQMEKRGWLERPGHTRPTRTNTEAKAYVTTERGRDQLLAHAKDYSQGHRP